MASASRSNSSRSSRRQILSATRSEEHTSELQSRLHLVCRLLLEKKKNVESPHNPLGTNAPLVNEHLSPSPTTFLILEYHHDDFTPRKDLNTDPIPVPTCCLPTRI